MASLGRRELYPSLKLHLCTVQVLDGDGLEVEGGDQRRRAGSAAASGGRGRRGASLGSDPFLEEVRVSCMLAQLDHMQLMQNGGPRHSHKFVPSCLSSMTCLSNVTICMHADTTGHCVTPPVFWLTLERQH